jgi:uncharacterized protein (DUF952 family)
VHIFHLALEGAWAQAQQDGVYRVSTLGLDLDDVGFVHCAQADQVDGVHERFYGSVTEPVVLLTIDTDLLTSPWQLDDVPGQPDPFPHVYGPVDVAAVVAAEPYVRGSASS